MAVNVNRVYQTVLTILNKEQRGYITPDEFNQLAIQAQKEIYDGYFYKLGRAVRTNPEIDPEVENIPFDILEKLQVFEVQLFEDIITIGTDANGLTSGIVILNDVTDIYRLGTILINDVEVIKKTKQEIGRLVLSPLLQPTIVNPVYYRVGNVGAGEIPSTVLNIYGLDPSATQIRMFYFRFQTDVNWVGTTMSGQAVPNISDSNYADFDLHISEEPELVSLILSYAGVVVRAPEVAQAAAAKAQQINQQES